MDKSFDQLIDFIQFDFIQFCIEFETYNILLDICIDKRILALF